MYAYLLQNSLKWKLMYKFRKQ